MVMIGVCLFVFVVLMMNVLLLMVSFVWVMCGELRR